MSISALWRWLSLQHPGKTLDVVTHACDQYWGAGDGNISGACQPSLFCEFQVCEKPCLKEREREREKEGEKRETGGA